MPDLKPEDEGYVKPFKKPILRSKDEVKSFCVEYLKGYPDDVPMIRKARSRWVWRTATQCADDEATKVAMDALIKEHYGVAAVKA
tara:strand:- start:537 stop:791 length:255 start_codon:yes stop_codon:yes gene_type:complete